VVQILDLMLAEVAFGGEDCVVPVRELCGWEDVVAQLYQLRMSGGESIDGLFVRLEIDVLHSCEGPVVPFLDLGE
jgi:hypothetical protein